MAFDKKFEKDLDKLKYFHKYFDEAYNVENYHLGEYQNHPSYKKCLIVLSDSKYPVWYLEVKELAPGESLTFTRISDLVQIEVDYELNLDEMTKVIKKFLNDPPYPFFDCPI